VVLLVGALYLVGIVVAGDKLPKGAVISGVAVGGLPRAEAVDRLRAELGPRLVEPMNVTANGQSAQIQPDAAGFSVDYDASVLAAGGGRSYDPREILQVLTGGESTDAVIIVDEAKLTAAVQAAAATLDRPAVNAGVAYEGTKVKKSPAEIGSVVDVDVADQTLRTHYLRKGPPIALPVTAAEPEVTTAEADQVVTEFAEPAVAGPITLDVDGSELEISPAMVASALTFKIDNGTLAPRLDGDLLLESAEKALAAVTSDVAKDAQVKLVDGKPKIIPSVDGKTVSADSLAAAVEPVLTKTGAERTATVEVTAGRAKFTTADAKKLGIKEVTGEFTTYFPYLPYRNVNIGRAAELIDGTLLEPGDTFSLNKVVGERTKANGFTEGYIIKGGKFEKELGGGVSQSATTTFNAMFFAGLKDVQHQPHSLYIDRYPPGREATVAWPSLDLKFKNDTEYGVLVEASMVKGTPSSRGSITVKMWSTKTWDKVTSTTPVRSRFTTGRNLKEDASDCEPQAPVKGFDVDYERLFYRDGKIAKREKFHWRYAPTDKVTCV
jgi:vancomycin resistance protein YoaR